MKKILLILLLFPLSLFGQVNLDNNFVKINRVDSSMTLLDAKLYQKGDSLYVVMAHDSVYLLTSRLQMGSQYLVSDTTTYCDTIGVYKKIVGRFLDGVNSNFDIDSLGMITFHGINGTNAMAIGVSDLSSDKQSKVTYVLYRNGVEVPNTTTSIDFVNPGKSKGISITKCIPNLRYGDYFNIYVTSDTQNTTVTHNTLMFSFICDR